MSWLFNLTILWHNTYRIKWGPFFRLRNAAKSFAITVEDPFIFVIQDTAYSVDEPLDHLKHLIRNSYRQHLLHQASLRRYDCQGTIQLVDISLTRSLLTGSVDHTQRLFKSNLVTSPLCPFCNMVEETSQHIFWDCSQWSFIRSTYPRLIRFYNLISTQWPNCFLHCGWVEQNRDYGFQLLEGLQVPVTDTHNMYLKILLARDDSTKVLRSTPQTPQTSLSQFHPPPFYLLLFLLYRSKTTFHPFPFNRQIRVKTTLSIVAVCQKK